MVIHAGQTLKIVTFFGFNKFVYPKKIILQNYKKKDGKLINDNINYSNNFFQKRVKNLFFIASCIDAVFRTVGTLVQNLASKLFFQTTSFISFQSE